MNRCVLYWNSLAQITGPQVLVRGNTRYQLVGRMSTLLVVLFSNTNQTIPFMCSDHRMHMHVFVYQDSSWINEIGRLKQHSVATYIQNVPIHTLIDLPTAAYLVLATPHKWRKNEQLLIQMLFICWNIYDPYLSPVASMAWSPSSPTHVSECQHLHYTHSPHHRASSTKQNASRCRRVVADVWTHMWWWRNWWKTLPARQW